MRILTALLVILPAALTAGPTTPYEPLAFLAGHCWRGAFPGGLQSDEHCFSWVYGGKFLRDVHTVRAAGRPDSQGESIYYWDSAAHLLHYLYIESDGGYSSGDVAVDGNALVFPDSSLIEDGQSQVYRSRWQKSGPQAYEVVTEFKGANSWSPGFKLHMQLVQ